MNLLPKYFTTPLSDKDRYSLYNLWGLNNFSYFLIESFKGAILRKSYVVGLNVNIDFGDIPFNDKNPIITTSNNEDSFFKKNVLSETSLWEELFPSPINQLANYFSHTRKVKLEICPAELLLELESLWDTLQKLENSLRNFEVNLLNFISSDKGGELGLIFHYVRKKRVRIGNINYLYEYWREVFSNSNGFYRKIDFFISCHYESPFRNLIEALRNGLESIE